MIPNTHSPILLLCSAVLLTGIPVHGGTPSMDGRDAPLGVTSQGVVIHKVSPDSPADEAGLKSDDILLSWRQGRARGQFEHWFQVTEVAREYAPRGPIYFNIRRNGQEQRVRVNGTFYWGLRLRPWMDPRDLELFRSGDEPDAVDTVQLETRPRSHRQFLEHPNRNAPQPR